MSGTSRKIATLTGILLIAASLVWAGPTHVNKLQLSHEGNFTVLTVEGDGVIRTAHQSVEAKEGKPFRIVLDCLASRHMLPEKAYADLPSCVITNIRTSQYAVTPEEVVRIVLDLREESVYRVEQNGNRVQVMVSDTKTPAFTAWRSDAQTQETQSPAPVVAQKAEPTPAKSEQQTVSPKKPSIVIANASEMPKPSVATKQEAKPAVVKEEAPKPKAEVVEVTKQQPRAVAQNSESSVERDTPIDSKPVPLQVKLGLTDGTPSGAKPQVAEKQSQPEQKPAPVVAQNNQDQTQKPAPAKTQVVEQPKKQETTVAKVEEPKQQVEQPKPAVPSVQKKPSILAHRDTQVKEPVKVNPNITNDTIRRAVAFASYDQSTDNPPRPGDEPKPKEVKNEEAEKPAQIEKPQAKPKEKTNTASDMEDEKAKLRPAPSSPVEKPVLAKSAESQKPEAPAPKKITSLPAPKEEDHKTTAAVDNTESVPQPGPAAKKQPSRFRRDAAQSARLKQAQVVQFPQRIVIKYKGASGRDPFKSLIDIEKQSNGRVDLNKIPNIETLHLVGVIESTQKGGKDAALMEDRDGIGYILKTGDRVRNGYVAQIDEHAVYFQITEYGWSRTVVKEMEKE